MKQLAPSLLVLISIAPLASALEVSDADVKLGLVLQLQARAERGWSRGADGNTYNVAENASSTPADTADFYLRRFRVGFAGSYKDDYRFRAVMRFDGADRTGDGALAASTTATAAGNPVLTKQEPSNRLAQINQAYIERIIKTEGGLEHSIRAGIDYPFFNSTAAIYPAATYLLPTDRPSGSQAWLAPRGAGVGYKLSGKVAGLPYTWGADIQNNQADDNNAYTGNSAVGDPTKNSNGEGLVYTTRVQMVALDSEAKGHMKPVESFVGAPGTGVLVGLEAGINRNDNTYNTTAANYSAQNLKAEGLDVLVHHNAVTALAEVRWRQLHTIGTNGGDSNVAGRLFTLQAGYAIAAGSTWIEPAIRWSRINQDVSNSEYDSYGSMTNAGMDFGSSGFQTDIGLNWYLNKTSNKVSIAYQNWRSEGGSKLPASPGDANANIIRLQWGLFF